MVPDSCNSKSKYYYKRIQKRKKRVVDQLVVEKQQFSSSADNHLNGSNENNQGNITDFNNYLFYSDTLYNYNNYDNYLFDYANQYNYYEPLYTWMPPNYSYLNNQFSTNYYDSVYNSYLNNNECNYLGREPTQNSSLDNDGITSELDINFLANNTNSSEINPTISKEHNDKSTVKHIKYILIDTPTNLKSLIDIIDSNEVSDDIEYNIDLKSLKSIKSELIELRDMVGMEKMKESVFQQLVYFVQNLHIGNDKNTGDFKHTVILGPPGTGKTRVAKIIGNMYAKLGVLKKNIFKKVTRNDLIAGYLGQTAIKTQKVIEDCLGGVLFIDEAYSLANEDREDSFSKECLDTLCEALSDHKDDLMVIIAGYENELNNRFFNSNKGLESRFIWRFKIEEYNAAELMRIYLTIVSQSGWEMLDNQISERWFQDKKDKFQGLGRDMEVLFTYSKMAHSLRIYGKDIEIRKKISLEDMDKAFKIFIDNLKKDERPSFINSIYI